MSVILASASPRRQELLKLITEDFKVIPANIDETVPKNIPSEKIPEILAVNKAEYISALYPDDIVIGSDTVVVLDEKIMGKPNNSDECFKMLESLSGRTHKVITGTAVCRNGRTQSFLSVSEVTFYKLSEKEIYDYIATGEPFDKAGGYGIQGYGSFLVEKINGDYFTIVGLPVAKLKRLLDSLEF